MRIELINGANVCVHDKDVSGESIGKKCLQAIEMAKKGEVSGYLAIAGDRKLGYANGAIYDLPSGVQYQDLSEYLPKDGEVDPVARETSTSTEAAANTETSETVSTNEMSIDELKQEVSKLNARVAELETLVSDQADKIARASDYSVIISEIEGKIAEAIKVEHEKAAHLQEIINEVEVSIKKCK